jgi:hypothetical protein
MKNHKIYRFCVIILDLRSCIFLFIKLLLHLGSIVKLFGFMHGLQLVRLCRPAAGSLTPSPFSARLVIIIGTFRHYGSHRLGLFHTRSTEAAIGKMVEASQRMITMKSQAEPGGMSRPLMIYLELQIKTLNNA